MNSCFLNSKHLDYLFLLKGDSVANSDPGTDHGNPVIHGVQLVVELTNEKSRNKENLVFNPDIMWIEEGK